MSGQRLPEGFIDEIKARVRLSDYIGRKVKLKKQGKSWVGLSPFSNEKSPSFYVHDEEGYYKCFSTQKGGDIIKYVQETERLEFMEALEKLADMAGMQMPKSTPEEKEVYDRRQRLLAVSEAAAAFFEDQLRFSEGAPARAYLEGRGLRASSWAKYRLGYSPDDWRKTIDYLKTQGFQIDEIIEAGLAVQKDGGGDPYDRFRGRVMFPIEDARGAVIAFGGRALEKDAKPKYLNSSDSPLFHKSKVLYRYKPARAAMAEINAPGLIVCEGYMDVIALSEAGFPNAVAPLGTALTEDQLSLLWRAGSEPILCFDGDSAGLRAAYRSIDRAMPFLSPERSLFFSLLPEGLDPDDLIRQRGSGVMAEALENAYPLVEVLWRRERDSEALDTPERRAGLEARLERASNLIQHTGVKAAYLQSLRQKARDHFWSLRVAGRTKNDGSGAGGGAAELKQIPPKISGLGCLVRAVDNPELLDVGGEELAEAMFPDPDVCLIRDALLDRADYDSKVDRRALCAHLSESGSTRAAHLLQTYPPTPRLDVNGPEAREWLTALEQLAAVGELEAGDDAGGEVFKSLDDAKRRRQRVAARQALKARMNEAAEKSDHS